MKSRVVSVLGVVFGLLLSPFLVVALGCLIWIVYYSIQGIGISLSITEYLAFIKRLSPYFPYLTIIPMVCVAVPLVVKYKNKIRTIFHK